MDNDRRLYIVSEEGGGDVDHPQLWVFAPSTQPNQAPTAVTLTNVVATLPENTSTATRLKVADVVVADDGIGTNVLTVTGPDAAFFEVDSTGLYIKAGTVLDYETRSTYTVGVAVDDPGAISKNHWTVRIRGSPSVTATECSKCAVNDPFTDTTVQLSDKTIVSSVPTSTIGSIATVIPALRSIPVPSLP
jgi:hypothetical protein